MSDYLTHARWGWIVGALTALTVALSGFFLTEDVSLSVGCGIASAVSVRFGAVFPDVDHPDSIPRRQAVTVLRVFGIIASITVAHEYPDQVALIIVGVVIYTVSIGRFLDVVTVKHRGWTHSPGVMGGVTGITVLPLVGTLGPSAAIFSTFYLGVLTHLWLDDWRPVRLW